MFRKKRYLVRLGVLFLVLILMAQSVAGAITMTTSSEYKGGVDKDSQAIQSTMTLSPNESKIIDVTITATATDKSFVDFSSRKRTITSPGSSEPEINYEGNGVWTINELEPDDEFKITFETYPRTIKSENLDVAKFTIEYTQEGQNLEDERTVTANLSQSSYFKNLENKKRVNELTKRVNELEKEKEDSGSLWVTVSTGLNLALGVLLVLVLVYYEVW